MQKAERRIRTRFRTRACALMAVIAVAGCNSRGPTGPSAAGSSSATYIVSGLVRDTVQRPIADATVEVISGVLSGSVTTTDREGRFSFGTPVSDLSAVTLRITRDGHHPATVPGRPNGVIVLVSIELADVGGRYTATFSASPTCTQIPEALRTRTYTATIAPTAQSRTMVIAELTGAMFQYGYSIFFGVLGSDTFRVFVASYDAFNWWLEDQPLIERLADGGHLSIFGTATTGVTAGSAITTTFDGKWSYCGASGQPGGTNWPLTCTVAEAVCQSQNHGLMLSR